MRALDGRPRARPGARELLDAGASPPNSISRCWMATSRRCSSESTTTSRPRRRIATRCATRSTSESVCEERNTVRPCAATSSSSAWKLCWTSGSRPAIGSSRISSSGSCMNAWIRPSFWRLPVDSSWIGRSSCGVEAFGERVAHRAVDTAAELGQVVQHRRAAQRRVEGEVAGQEADPPPDLQAVRPAVETEQRRRPGGRLDQVEQQPHRRRLARAVRAEETEDLAARDLEIEIEEPVPLAVVLRQARDPDRELALAHGRRFHDVIPFSARLVFEQLLCLLGSPSA